MSVMPKPPETASPSTAPGDARAPHGGLMGQFVRGFGWIFAWRMTMRMLGLASTLLMVRLLTPAQLGAVTYAGRFPVSCRSRAYGD